MARGKKKESALTPEEKLAQALIPDWEQPYKVPKNWCWVRFGQLAVDMADGPFGSNLKTEHYTQEKQARIIQLSNIGENGWREENTKYTTFEHAKTISRSIVEPGNIVIAKMMPAGRAIICPNAEAQYVLSSDAVKMIPHSQLNSKYLLFQINSHHFQLQVQENTQGITRARTSIKKLKEYAFAVAPLDEQQRIVDRIESLFAKLDEAKEKAQSVLDSFETRKAAILHKAFTGELTAKWRAECSVPFTQNSYLLNDVFNFIDYRGMTPDKTDEGVPLITAKNIKKGYIDYRISEFISYETYLQRQGRGVARRNDLLITTEAPLGNVALADQDTYSTAQRVIVLQLREEYRNKIENNYVMHYMLAEAFQTKLQDQKTGSTVAGIKAAKLKLIPIDLPCVDEQKEVVRILDSLFTKEQQAKEAAEAVLEKIDLLKKSILARAFRGELGTNDPTEESALELLKTLLQ